MGENRHGADMDLLQSIRLTHTFRGGGGEASEGIKTHFFITQHQCSVPLLEGQTATPTRILQSTEGFRAGSRSHLLSSLASTM